MESNTALSNCKCWSYFKSEIPRTKQHTRNWLRELQSQSDSCREKKIDNSKSFLFFRAKTVNPLPFDFSWKNLIWSSNYHIVKFVLHASINWIKTPELLNLWGYTNSSACRLCQAEKCTLHHILSNCPVALTSKRYTWRHDSVLLHIQKALEILITDSN